MNCPSQPAHGRVYELRSGRWYCPHAEHDRTGSPRFFDEAQVFEQHVRPREERLATSPTSRRSSRRGTLPAK